MTEGESEILHESGQVKVTRAWAAFGETSYPIHAITSVGLAQQEPSACLPTGLFIVGGVAAALGFYNMVQGDGTGFVSFALGALFLLGGFGITRSARASYSVRLGTAGGDRVVFSSNDRAIVESIVDAIGRAVALKS